MRASLRSAYCGRGRKLVKGVRKEFTLSKRANGAAPPTARVSTIAPSERTRVSGYEEMHNSPLVPREGSMPDARKDTHAIVRELLKCVLTLVPFLTCI